MRETCTNRGFVAKMAPSRLRFKMKTNSIFTILLLLFMWFNTAIHPCICPEARSTATNQHQHVLCSHEAGETCGDCGHSTKCCASHRDFPMATSAVAHIAVVVVAVAQCLKFLEIETNGQKRDLTLICHDHAPPWPTPHKLHQLLLI